MTPVQLFSCEPWKTLENQFCRESVNGCFWVNKIGQIKKKQILGFYRLTLRILTSKNCVLLSSIQKWLLGCFWLFSYAYTVNQVLYIPLSRFKITDVWKMWFIKYTVKMNDSSFRQVLREKSGLIFVLTLESAFS